MPNDNRSLSHTKWNCKCHIVFAPKYRRKVFFQEKREAMEKIKEHLRIEGRERLMKQVQQALRDIGIPVIAGVWRTTSPDQNPPAQYSVYSSTTTESSHSDDCVTSYRTYVYLNLWSDIDPTEMAKRINQAMYSFGFSMLEQSDKGYNQPAYDTSTRKYTVQWTWVWYEESEVT